MNLKPSPSRLSKQKQRLAWLMNIHHPRNPTPATPPTPRTHPEARVLQGPPSQEEAILREV